MLCSKNRVNPLKSTATIPRLELQAAVLCTSLESSISKALSIQLLPTSFWTDSMIVLGFINNTQRRFHTYVSNRINKIRQRSDPSQWFFVPGDVNPADVLTRKKLPSQFDQKSWMNGPAFLATHKDTWSVTRSITPTLPNIHPDIKPEAPTAMAVIATKEPIDELINHYSSWHRLKRSVAWLKRFLKVLQKKAQPSDHLEADEVAWAEQCIIKHVQSSAFSADIKLTWSPCGGRASSTLRSPTICKASMYPTISASCILPCRQICSRTLPSRQRMGCESHQKVLLDHQSEIISVQDL